MFARAINTFTVQIRNTKAKRYSVRAIRKWSNLKVQTDHSITATKLSLQFRHDISQFHFTTATWTLTQIQKTKW